MKAAQHNTGIAKTCLQKRITTPFRRRRAASIARSRVTGAPGGAARSQPQTPAEEGGHVGEFEIAGVRPEVRLR